MFKKNSLGQGIDYNKIPYCENPALGMEAPECSEDCCDYSDCEKNEKFRYIAKKHSGATVETITNAAAKALHFNIEGKDYSFDEVIEVLKKHKAEEDKKLLTCFCCGDRYLENKAFDMVRCDMDEKPESSAYAFGYATTPYIRGFKILSTCGNGKEIHLCDNCLEELIGWLTEKDFAQRIREITL